MRKIFVVVEVINDDSLTDVESRQFTVTDRELAPWFGYEQLVCRWALTVNVMLKVVLAFAALSVATVIVVSASI